MDLGTRITSGMCIFMMLIAFPFFSSAQGDALDRTPEFEKVLLNGQLAYRDKNTGKFLPGPHREGFVEVLRRESNRDVFNEYWDNNKYKVYPKEPLEWPVHVTFPDSVYATPINRPMVVTSRYGWRGGQPHNGIDIDLITGDLVMAMLPGKVRWTKYVGGMGRTVVIRHDNGLETIYGHLSKIFVKENEVVKQGQSIGRGGTTGNARGSHLHLEVHFQGHPINPEYFFEFSESAKIRAKDCWVTAKWANARKHRSTRQSKLIIHETLASAEFHETTPVTAQKKEKLSPPVKQKKTQSSSVVKASPPNKKLSSRIPVLAAPDLGTDGKYVVQPGDTLFSISKRYGVPVQDICAHNGIGDNYVIKVGQSLTVVE